MKLPSEPTRDFPYHVEEQIGEGSMGEVYRARETNLDRRAAIKVLRSKVLEELSEEDARNLSRRFLQEARASAKINHPGVVTVHRLGTVNGRSFIAMEWLEGDDLRDRIERDAPLATDEARRIAGDLLETLEAAHSRDIVHRDLKPGNIKLEPDGRVVLTDFGIARVRNSKLVKTQAGEILGTPIYAAPEQLLDDPIDASTDLYALGVVIFEMLTGDVPHDGDTVGSVTAKRLEKDPPLPSSMNPSVPEEFDAVVRRALRKRPDDRFESAKQMRAALETGVMPEAESTEGDALADTAVDARGSAAPDEPSDQTPVVLVDGSTRIELAVRAARNWPADPLGKRKTEQLLDKLLETPIHADPFAGAVQLEDALLFIYEGLVYAGVNLETEEVGDAVIERIPETAPATLFPVPDQYDDRLAPHLASLLYEPDRAHADLDSSFTNLEELVERLQDEGFDGVVRLESEGELGYLILDRGERLVDLFSENWSPNPAERSWREWIAEMSVTAHVERRRTSLPSVTYRRELRDLDLDVTPASEGHEVEGSVDDSQIGMRHSTWIVQPRVSSDDDVDGRASTIWRDIYESDPNYQLLKWLLEDLPAYLEERGRFGGWKYLAHWIEQVAEARLYTDLPRPNERASDFFGLVTKNPEEKVLHVARRKERVDAGDLETFVSDVKSAKQARIDRGDIGGALFVGAQFGDDVRETYRELIGGDEGSWLFNLQNSMTGYEGFVRMGSRRGFHLMLVERVDDGFEPLLPPES